MLKSLEVRQPASTLQLHNPTYLHIQYRPQPRPMKMLWRLSFALTLTFASTSVNAYNVNSPNANTGWVSTGSNTVTWGRVSTDPTTFDLVLANSVRFIPYFFFAQHSPLTPITSHSPSLTLQQYGSVYPKGSQLLASNVDGKKGSFTLTVANIPAGPHYRLNLNRVGNGGILAQSVEFTESNAPSGGGGTPVSSS